MKLDANQSSLIHANRWAPRFLRVAALSAHLLLALPLGLPGQRAAAQPAPQGQPLVPPLPVVDGTIILQRVPRGLNSQPGQALPQATQLLPTTPTSVLATLAVETVEPPVGATPPAAASEETVASSVLHFQRGPAVPAAEGAVQMAAQWTAAPLPAGQPVQAPAVAVAGTTSLPEAPGALPPTLSPSPSMFTTPTRFPRTEPEPGRRSFVDLSAAPCFAHAPDYSWIVGQVEYSCVTKEWRLRYASVDEVDRFGGRVILIENHQVSYMVDGIYVQARGHLVNPKDNGSGPAYYRVESFQTVTNPNLPPMPAGAPDGRTVPALPPTTGAPHAP
jgi:hypothetical protein